jgi:prepilin-type N-terminal cleavage/methylation domain-containing protein
VTFCACIWPALQISHFFLHYTISVKNKLTILSAKNKFILHFMKMPSLQTKNKRLLAFTLIELLVVISIIAILASLAIPSISGAMGRAQMVPILNNMRELHKFTVIDSSDPYGDKTLGWPGDDGVTWRENMIEHLGGESGGGDAAFEKMLTVQNEENAVIVTNVTTKSPNHNVFLHTNNWSGSTLDADKPLGEKGFVVFRKGGEGAMLTRRQASNEELTGVLP